MTFVHLANFLCVFRKKPMVRVVWLLTIGFGGDIYDDYVASSRECRAAGIRARSLHFNSHLGEVRTEQRIHV